ncbi:MAG: PAS domain S-box protein [Proteobacteria bacterium]|nr:PAS domain S-box protein [Pseudomonadota bacterium]MBU1715379.1 PAS domain S-box protein [Pseudomonadota bacterium]
MKNKISTFISSLGLNWKFSIAFLSLIIIVGLTTSIFIISFMTQTMRTELDEKGMSVTRNLAANTTETVLVENKVKLQLLLNNIKISERDAVYAFVLDQDGKVLAHTFTKGFPQNLAAANKIEPSQTYRIQILKNDDEYIRDIGVPMIGGEAGSAHIGFSEKHINHAIAHAKTSLFRLLIIPSLLSILIAFFLSRRIADPLIALTKSAEAIGRGNLDQKIPVTSQDEIGRLAHTFNQMTAALKKYITDIREKEESLSFKNLVLTTQQENSLDGILVIDQEGTVVSFNQNFIKMWEVPAKIINSKSDKRILQNIMSKLEIPEQLVRLSKNFYENPSVESRQDLTTVDGRIFDCYSAPMIDKNGKNHGRVWYSRDVTERTNAEKALAREKELLTVTLRSIGDGMISTDVKGNILLINNITENLTGWSQEEAYGQPLSEVFRIIDEKTRQPSKNPVQQVLTTNNIVGLDNHTVLIARDGTEYSIADSAAPIRDKDGKTIGAVLVFRDVSMQQKIESELARVEKLDALGVLAGGIAHDFNNILTGIIGNISLSKTLLEDKQGKVFTRLTEAEKASQRAQKLTKQLITFAKGGSPVKTSCSITELLEDSASFVLGGSNVRCEFKIADDLWLCDMDEGQIGQVISNLIINADHAMPTGGVIKISAENMTINPESNLPLQDGNYVKITITDEGSGIKEENLPKIFDPYFTTKSTGSGLGLATSFSIMHKHQGLITVESKENIGTTFFLYLRAITDNKQPAIKNNSQMATISGKGKILIMDDEEIILDIAQEMLKEIGYTPVPARNGEEAIKLYNEAINTNEPFDVVILDLTIPGGMGGLEVIERIRATDHEIKAIVSSGYAIDPILADHKKFGFDSIMSKPYKLHELSEALFKVL